MIVLQAEAADFALPDVERQLPIAADRNASCPGSVALKLVHAAASTSTGRAWLQLRNRAQGRLLGFVDLKGKEKTEVVERVGLRE